MEAPSVISIPEKVKKIVFKLLEDRHTEEELEWQVPDILSRDLTVQSLAVLEPLTEAPLDIPSLIQQAVADFKKTGRRLRTWKSEGLLFN